MLCMRQKIPALCLLPESKSVSGRSYMTSTISLSEGLRNNLFVAKSTQRAFDKTSFRLGTGKKVNSAIDNPLNFFKSSAFGKRANILTRKLDDIALSLRTIEEADKGLQGIERMLKLAKSIANERLTELRAIPGIQSGPDFAPLPAQILAANPVSYFQLDDAGNPAADQGSLGVNANYLNGPTFGAGQLYAEGSQSVEFNGVNQGVHVLDNNQINLSPQSQRTVELVFNANTTAGRQVLYEEGAGVNAFSIYIDDGELYINGRDQGAWGPGIISTPIQAGETYHVAFTFDFTGENRFTGYLNGSPIGFFNTNAIFPSHSGDVGIGFMNDSTWFHDGSQAGDGFYFNGRISDVAIYNDRLSDSTLYSHASSVLGNRPVDRDEEFELVLDQIDLMAKDSGYKGINLLLNNDLFTDVNEDGTSNISTTGRLMTSEGLNIQRDGFSDERELPRIIDSIDNAIAQVRAFQRHLAIDINMLTTREEFTIGTINNLRAGSNDLTLADINKEAANLLALDTRTQLGQVSLALAGDTMNNVLDLFA